MNSHPHLSDPGCVVLAAKPLLFFHPKIFLMDVRRGWWMA
jgi:hypothetical protein